MEKYNKLIIYYFTGTGNALKAGRWICEETEKRNIETCMYAIDDNYKANPDEFDSKTLIGFLLYISKKVISLNLRCDTIM